jgi:hypothetical protein
MPNKAVLVQVQDDTLIIRGSQANIVNNTVGSANTTLFSTGVPDNFEKLPGNAYKVEKIGFTPSNMSNSVAITHKDEVRAALNGLSVINTSGATGSVILYEGAIINPNAISGNFTAQIDYCHNPILAAGFVSITGSFWVLLRRLS